MLVGGVGLLHLGGGGRGGGSGSDAAGWGPRRLAAALGDGNSMGGSWAGGAAGFPRSLVRVRGMGRHRDAGFGQVNLRRSVTTKGLFCSDMVTFSDGSDSDGAVWWFFRSQTIDWENRQRRNAWILPLRLLSG